MFPAQKRFAITLLLIASSVGPVVAQSLPPFVYAPNIDVGQNPVAIASGDFNGDGRQDMVVASQGGHELRIFLADANGRFSRADKYRLQFNPADVVVADVNGDHKLDIVVATAGPDASGGFSVLLGNGDGTFQPEIPYELPGQAFTLAVGDFNGDGAPDLAVSFGYGKGSGTAIILNKGNGTFGAPAGVINFVAKSIIVGDFNGDHKLDLICSTDVEIQIFGGNGDGTFESGEELGPGMDNYALALAVGDLNGDGKLDFVAAGTNVDGVGTVWVYLGNGDGTFQTAISYFSGSWKTDSVVLADFNGDGRLDIAASNYNVDACILYGRGDGTFEPRVGYMAFQPTSTVYGLAAVGNDLVATVGGSDIAILAGNGKGDFQAARDYPLGEAVSPLNFAFGDINGDGLVDMAIPDYQGVNIYLNKGHGEFRQPYSRGLGGGAVALGDFNNDGNLDLVSGTREIQIQLGDGRGNFGHAITPPAPFAISGTVASFATGDFNKDGNLDIAVADSNREIYVLIGNGDGTFHFFAYPLPIYPYTILVGDLNGDGNLDLFASGEAGGVVLEGNGDGTFQPAVLLENLPYATYAVLADFNGDGILDLALASSGNGVDVAFGRGDGTFHHPQPYGSGGDSLVAGDFNGDGILDLATGDGIWIELLYGNGDGTFQQPVTFDAVQLWGLGSADLNGDGLPDLVLVDTYGVNDGDQVGIAFNRHGKKF